jgi:hypothetical protein
LLSQISNRAARLRCSMYADDAAVFINPVREEVTVVADIL